MGRLIWSCMYQLKQMTQMCVMHLTLSILACEQLLRSHCQTSPTQAR